MKRILFLLIISLTDIMANDLLNKTKEKGCVISFSKEVTPCSSSLKKEKITIAPIVIKKVSKKKPQNSKKLQLALRNILNVVKKNNIETNKLHEELTSRNKEFKQYNIKTNRLNEELNRMKQEFKQYKIKKNKELKKVKNQLYSTNKKIKSIKRPVKVISKKKRTIISRPIINRRPSVHKVISKMQPSPILMYDTPWIEIIVENNINIYDLALKYYGNKQEYKNIYVANQNIISNDLKIYNGMALIIPMTTLFEEQGVLLNQSIKMIR